MGEIWFEIHILLCTTTTNSSGGWMDGDFITRQITRGEKNDDRIF